MRAPYNVLVLPSPYTRAEFALLRGRRGQSGHAGGGEDDETPEKPPAAKRGSDLRIPALTRLQASDGAVIDAPHWSPDLRNTPCWMRPATGSSSSRESTEHALTLRRAFPTAWLCGAQPQADAGRPANCQAAAPMNVPAGITAARLPCSCAPGPARGWGMVHSLSRLLVEAAPRLS